MTPSSMPAPLLRVWLWAVLAVGLCGFGLGGWVESARVQSTPRLSLEEMRRDEAATLNSVLRILCRQRKAEPDSLAAENSLSG